MHRGARVPGGGVTGRGCSDELTTKTRRHKGELMPHDAKGNILKPGDKVVIPATVIAVHESDEFCNCDVEFDHPMPPYTEKTRYSALNTRQVEKLTAEG